MEHSVAGKYGTRVASPRTGCPSKIAEKTQRNLIMEAANSPAVSLKELQEFTELLFTTWQWGEFKERNFFLEKPSKNG